MIKNIVLASGSPRRRELLAGLGWEFRVEPSLITETKPEGETPAHLVKRLAFEKASEVAGRFPGNWVVGADTVVAIDGMILGKPKDEAEAKSMLRRLAGETHSVFTGVALIAPDGRSLSETEETKVTFRPLSDDEISASVACRSRFKRHSVCGESMDKAGAYAIQGRGTLLASRIEGCYFNVVGLPLFLLSRMFASMGAPLSAQWGNE